MAVETSAGQGQYVASEWHVGCLGRAWRSGGKRATLVHGGRGQTALGNMPPDAITRDLAETGGPIGYFDCVDGKQWGNDTSQTRVGQLWALLQSAFGGKSDKLCLYGTSMGGSVVLNWALANLAAVACIALVIPTVDLGDIYDNNRTASLGFTASTDIDAAYGGSAAWAAARPTHNPAVNAASLRGLPIKVWYSGSDPVCTPATQAAFAAAAGASTVNMGNVGHASNPAFASDVFSFLSAYA